MADPAGTTTETPKTPSFQTFLDGWVVDSAGHFRGSIIGDLNAGTFGIQADQDNYLPVGEHGRVRGGCTTFLRNNKNDDSNPECNLMAYRLWDKGDRGELGFGGGIARPDTSNGVWRGYAAFVRGRPGNPDAKLLNTNAFVGLGASFAGPDSVDSLSPLGFAIEWYAQPSFVDSRFFAETWGMRDFVYGDWIVGASLSVGEIGSWKGHLSIHAQTSDLTDVTTGAFNKRRKLGLQLTGGDILRSKGGDYSSRGRGHGGFSKTQKWSVNLDVENKALIRDPEDTDDQYYADSDKSGGPSHSSDLTTDYLNVFTPGFDIFVGKKVPVHLGLIVPVYLSQASTQVMCYNDNMRLVSCASTMASKADLDPAVDVPRLTLGFGF